nr:6320_t:CDS:10 [Entrophospora candida]
MAFEPGNVVYAKLKGFPWWPARVENEEEVPEDVLEKKPRGQNISVRFFGTRNYGWVGNKDVKAFDKKEADDKLQDLKDTKRDQLLADSIREAFDPSSLDDEEEDEVPRKKSKNITNSRKPKGKGTSSTPAKSSKAKVNNNKKVTPTKSNKTASKVKDNGGKKKNVANGSKSSTAIKKGNEETQETGTRSRAKRGNKVTAGENKDGKVNGTDKKTNKRSRADITEDTAEDATGNDDSDGDEETVDKKIINKEGDKKSTESIIIANGEQSVNDNDTDKNGEGNDSGEEKEEVEENGVEKDVTAEECLNSLQTNAGILEAIRKSGGALNSKSLPEMRNYCLKIGYESSEFDKLNIIHVTGTKGKGSTCAFVESILRNFNTSSGRIRTGLYSSPHLIAVRERIRLDGKILSEGQFTKYFFEPDEQKNTMPTYFRFLTLMAFHVFMREKVDVAIMEVGVGGEYDSTNIIEKPIVCGVTSLGLDHQITLGDTIDKIAWHKGGIFKSNVPALTVEQPEAALNILKKRAQDINAPFVRINSFNEEILGDIKLGLAGKHQYSNAALAVELSKEFIKGLNQVNWPGRSQTIKLDKYPGVTWFFDGAHTLESLQACMDWFKDNMNSYPSSSSVEKILIFNCTNNRNGKELLKKIITSTCNDNDDIGFNHALFCRNVTYSSNNYKIDLVNNTVDLDEDLKLQKSFQESWIDLKKIYLNIDNDKNDDGTQVFSSIQDTIEWIIDYKQNNNKEIIVMATGSLHLIGGIMAVLGIDVQ